MRSEIVLWLCLVLGGSFLNVGSGRRTQSAETPSVSAPEQPLPFSHKKHAGAGMECGFCHELGGTGEQAGIPQADKCILCHDTEQTNPSLEKLAVHYRQRTPIPWARVYQLPKYVFFSHRKHLQAGAACAECHGPVQQRDILLREKDISMAACVDCHLARSAPIDCMHCHTSVPGPTAPRPTEPRP